MKKREAFELARSFIEDHPGLAHRPVRVVLAPPEDDGVVTELYVVRMGPRGGMRRSRLIDEERDGAMIHTLESGDVLMRKDIAGGWPSYDSTPVLPHMENPGHAGREFAGEFSIDEKLASVRWAIDKGVYEDAGEAERILAALRAQKSVEDAWDDIASEMRQAGRG